MSLTQNWTNQDYLNHIKKNKLDLIWFGYCNPKSVDAIRLSAYTPIYNDKIVELLERKCTRKNCDGSLVVPLDDRVRKVVNKIVCNGNINGGACGNYKMILYRWVSAGDQSKLWFQDIGTIKHYGDVGRTFYATLSLYDRKIIPKNALYVNESLMRAHTLGMDIDIKKGTICESINKEEIDKVLEIVREQLDTFVGGSYNLQTSGNGLYIFLHHNLLKVDIFNQMGRFNGWIRYLNDIIKEKDIRRIKIDAINMSSRVFKLIGSIHQKYDLVCIPIEFDTYLSKVNNNEFKLEHFDIDKYIVDGKLQFYNRFEGKDKKSLYDFLEENSQKHPYGDLRAIRYNYKKSSSSNIGISAITGEESSLLELDSEINIKNREEISIENREEISIENREEISLENESIKFSDYYTGWKPFDADIPGRIIHKKRPDGSREVEMLGVDEKDIDKILDKIWGEK
jgi:hypothetical protein